MRPSPLGGVTTTKRQRESGKLLGVGALAFFSFGLSPCFSSTVRSNTTRPVT